MKISSAGTISDSSSKVIQGGGMHLISTPAAVQAPAIVYSNGVWVNYGSTFTVTLPQKEGDGSFSKKTKP